MTKLLASTKQVTQAIDQLAAQLIDEYGEQQPLYVALLRGAMPFASRLMFAIVKQSPQAHPELDYMMTSTYGSGTVAQQPRIVVDLSPQTVVAGRTIIVLDDVIDQGVTARLVMDHLAQRGATQVKLATLIDKELARPDTVERADYSCFRAGPEWLAGMGLDEATIGPEANRWLDEVRIV